MNHEDTADRVRQVLDDLSISQAELARAAGVNRTFINSVVKGRRAPSDAVIDVLRREYGVSPEWVRTGEGDPFLHAFAAASVDNAKAGIFLRPTDTRRAEVVDSDVYQPEEPRLHTIVRQLVAEVSATHVPRAHSEMHELLDQALPPNAPEADVAVVRAVLDSLIAKRRARES